MPRTDALPTATDAESKIIGSVLLDPECFTEAAKTVGPEHFADTLCRGIFEAMSDLWEDGGEINPQLVLRKLRGHPELEAEQTAHTLAQIAADTVTAANLAVHLEDVTAAYRLRELGRHARDLVNIVCRKLLDEDRERQISFLTQRIEAHSKGVSPNRLVIRNLSDVEPQDVEWLWRRRVAIGKLTLVPGDPGLGKSLLSLDMSARVSRGASWPDAPHEPQPVGGVVLLSAEDDLADTIRPRLDAHQADVTRIVALQSVTFSDELGEVRRGVDLSQDLPHVETAIDTVDDCRLVVVDPISAFLGGTDSHKNAEVRGVLSRLAELAERKRVAVVAVTHLRKSEGSAIYRAMGSMAFVAAARAAWCVIRDESDPIGRRLFLPLKNNLAADSTGLAFCIDDYNGVPVVSWFAETITTTAEEAMSRQKKRGPKPVVTEEAADWLAERLAAGPQEAGEIIHDAEAKGFSTRTVQRAFNRIGGTRTKSGFSGGWLWSLDDDDQDARLADQDASEGAKTPYTPDTRHLRERESSNLSSSYTEDAKMPRRQDAKFVGNGDVSSSDDIPF